MTVTPLHRTPGDQLHEQLTPDTLEHACVVYFDDQGNLRLMVSDLDLADIAYAGTMLQAVATKASMGGGRLSMNKLDRDRIRRHWLDVSVWQVRADNAWREYLGE